MSHYVAGYLLNLSDLMYFFENDTARSLFDSLTSNKKPTEIFPLAAQALDERILDRGAFVFYESDGTNHLPEKLLSSINPDYGRTDYYLFCHDLPEAISFQEIVEHINATFPYSFYMPIVDKNNQTILIRNTTLEEYDSHACNLIAKMY